MVDTRTLNGVQLKLMKILSRFNLNLVCLDTYFFITCGLKILMNYSFETRVKVSHSHSVLLWSAKDGTEAGQNLKYTIRSTPGQRLSQCKKKYPSSFSTYFTPVVHTNDDPLCQNLKLWGNFDFFTFLF